MGQIEVIVKRVGEEPERVTISNDMESINALIEGYAEGHVIRDDLMVLCDEDGNLFGKEYNVTINGIDYVGTIVIVGLGEEDFIDAPRDIAWTI